MASLLRLPILQSVAILRPQYVPNFRLAPVYHRGRHANANLAVTAYDIRFPTYRALDGSDAMHPDPDYSAAYVILQTDHPAGLEGHAANLSCGTERGVLRGGSCAGPGAPGAGQNAGGDHGQHGSYWRTLTSDGQLRWVGPEKGVLHLATGASWETPSGISGPRWPASPSGNWWWT